MLRADAMVSAWSPVPSALEALPMVKPLRLVPKVQPALEKAPVKSLPKGSMRSAPGPLMLPDSAVGALLLNTRAPPEMVVVPL